MQRIMVIAVLIGGLVGSALPVQPASAVTAELAKKCSALAMKAHPPQRPGTKTGSAKAQQEYFRACVAKEGNVEDPKQGKK